MPSIWKKLRRALSTLHLADKCLLVFMLILLGQSAHNLLFHELALLESSALDVVVRTTAAAIFGYFISANFQNGSRDALEPAPHDGASGRTAPPLPQTGSQRTARIGFSADAAPEHGGTASAQDSPPKQRNCLQILVVAAIGVVSLLLLITAQNFFTLSDTATATVSQLRDFVSGSVGFLIGHTTHPAQPI